MKIKHLFTRIRAIFCLAIGGFLIHGHAQVTLEDFETPTYSSGTSIGSYTGWSVSAGAANVNTVQAQSGTQSVTLYANSPDTEISRTLSLTGSDISFSGFWLKPVAEPSASAQNAIDLDNSLVAFVKNASTGEIHLLDGDGLGGAGTWSATAYSYSLDGSDRAQNWIRLTLRQDFTNDIWDIYLDGYFYAINLGFETNVSTPASFVLFGDDSADSYLDDFQMDADNMLFPDDDRDGMPNSYEDARGLNENANDRDSDLDGDGSRNVLEYMNGTLPDFDESTISGGIYFVNNEAGHGNDANDGLSAYFIGTSGPKNSVQGGLTAATNGDTVILLPGGATYAEGNLDLGGKDLKLRPIGNAVLK